MFDRTIVPSIAPKQWDKIVEAMRLGDTDSQSLAKAAGINGTLAMAALFALAEWGEIDLFLGVFHESDVAGAIPRMLRPFADGFLPDPVVFDDVGIVTSDQLRYTVIGRASKPIVFKDTPPESPHKSACAPPADPPRMDR